MSLAVTQHEEHRAWAPNLSWLGTSERPAAPGASQEGFVPSAEGGELCQPRRGPAACRGDTATRPARG